MAKKVLIVDNSPVILKLVSQILEKEGHTVKTAENGLAALELLEAFHPDVIFIDLIMPKISGDVLCRIIRSKKEFHQVVLVILSAVAAEEEDEYIKFGADAYIAKGPVTEMTKHILYVLEHCKVGKYQLSSNEILGLDSVHKREITSELLSTKHHFEVTLEHMTDGFIELTHELKIIYANRRAADLFNIPKEQLISSQFLENFQEKPQHEISSCINRVKKKLKIFEIGEDEVIDINGKRILLKFIPVQEKSGNSIFALMRDISRRKKLKEQVAENLICLEQNIALRTEEYLKSKQLLQEEINKRVECSSELSHVVKQLDATIDIIPDLISIHDKNMRLVRVNKAFADTFNINPEEILGTHCYKLMHKDGFPSPSCPHVEAARLNKIITKDVDDFINGKIMRVSCNPFYDDDEKLLGVVHIAREIIN